MPRPRAKDGLADTTRSIDVVFFDQEGVVKTEAMIVTTVLLISSF